MSQSRLLLSVLGLIAIVSIGCTMDVNTPTESSLGATDPDLAAEPEQESLALKSRLHAYRVTIENLTSGQPLSPPVAATHRKGIRMFRVRRLASPELEAIAEDGNQIPMFDLFDTSRKVTQAIDIGMPLTPHGTVVGSFTDQVTFDIMARKGDRFSLATMLICTNDGFTGLDAVKLPKDGKKTFWLKGYDAGTEDNTEQSADIVDPCSGLGPTPLTGDPDGNEDASADTQPHQRIRRHPGIGGGGELSVALHTWENPIVKVTITKLEDDDDDDDDDDDLDEDD